MIFKPIVHFLDKSTNFGTEANQYIMSKSGVEPSQNCPLAAVAAIFQNGRQLAVQEGISHEKWDVTETLFSKSNCFWSYEVVQTLMHDIYTISNKFIYYYYYLISCDCEKITNFNIKLNYYLFLRFFLAASSRKRNVAAWRPSVCLSVPHFKCRVLIDTEVYQCVNDRYCCRKGVFKITWPL